MWIISKPSPVPVTVITSETELELNINHNATGQMLFDQVTKTIGLREVTYFGLEYYDDKNIPAWLDLSEKIMSQDIAKVKYDTDNRLQFWFKVKFYPEDVNTEIIQESTQRLFYIHICDSILKDVIYCPPETAVILACYSLQARYGDYQDKMKEYIRPETLMPSRVIPQYTLTTDQWRERIGRIWKSMAGTEPEEAMHDYLKVAQDLEMYGVAYWPVKNKKGTELFLGIDAHGFSVYSTKDKLTPEIGFPWSEIRTVRYDQKKFIIKPTDKKAPQFIFYLQRARFAARMLHLASGNHERYMARRAPEKMEIKQMRAQAAEEKAAKKLERERLQREVEARKAAELKQQQMVEQMKTMAEEAEAKVKQFTEAQEKITSLEKQLNNLRDAKAQLEAQHAELEGLNAKLALSSQMEAAEKEKLAKEVAEKQAAYSMALEALQSKDSETKRLQEEVAKVKELSKAVSQSSVESSTSTKAEDEEAEDASNGKAMTNEVHLSAGGDDADALPRPEEAREPQINKVKTLQMRIQELSSDLESKAKDKPTATDLLHRENVRKGRNKYKTLKAIRHGNTLRRVDYFENM